MWTSKYISVAISSLPDVEVISPICFSMMLSCLCHRGSAVSRCSTIRSHSPKCPASFLQSYCFPSHVRATFFDRNFMKAVPVNFWTYSELFFARHDLVLLPFQWSGNFDKRAIPLWSVSSPGANSSTAWSDSTTEIAIWCLLLVKVKGCPTGEAMFSNIK